MANEIRMELQQRYESYSIRSGIAKMVAGAALIGGVAYCVGTGDYSKGTLASVGAVFLIPAIVSADYGIRANNLNSKVNKLDRPSDQNDKDPSRLDLIISSSNPPEQISAAPYKKAQ